MKTIRVTVKFTGRIQGALGVSYPMERRKTIEVPDQFTYAEACEAARVALYKQLDTDKYDFVNAEVYENVNVLSVAFN